MANELRSKHITVGPSITQAEYEQANGHTTYVDSGAEGDILVGTSTVTETGVSLNRLAIGANKKIVQSNGTTLSYVYNDTLQNSSGTDILSVSSTGEVTVGSSQVGYYPYRFAGSFTSDGASSVMAGFVINPTITSANGDTDWVTLFGMGDNLGTSITTQDNSETISSVSTMFLAEPDITKGTDTITNASTLAIVSAPTEGENNYAIYVGAGNVHIAGDLNIVGNVTDDLVVFGNISNTGTALFSSGTFSSVTPLVTFGDGSYGFSSSSGSLYFWTGGVGFTFDTGDVEFDGDIHTTGSLDVDTDLNVDGDVVIDGDCDVAGYVSSPSLYDVSTEGLELAMNFNTDSINGTTYLDSSNENNHGVDSGGTAVPNGGFNGGGCYDAAAVGDILIPDHASLNPTDEITVSAWVKWNGAGAITTSQFHWLVTKGSSSSATLGWELIVDSGDDIAFYVNGLAAQADAATVGIVKGTWYHLVGTAAGGGNILLYLDGVQIGTNSGVANPIVASTEDVSIGSVDYTASIYADARFDDVRVYDRVLSAAEVKAMYLGRQEVGDAYLGKQTTVLDVQTQPGSPKEGQVIYNSATNKLNFWNGASWEVVTSA